MERIEELEKLAKEYGQVLDQIDIFTQLKDNLRQSILLMFENKFGHEGATYLASTGEKLQRVIQHNLEYDAVELKNSLSSIQWNIIKKEAVDSKKLNAAIELGQIKLGGAISQIEVDKVCYKPVK